MYCFLIILLAALHVSDTSQFGADGSLADRMGRLETLLLQLEVDKQRLDKRVSILEVQKEALENRVLRLEKDVYELTAENKDLREHVHQLTADNKNQKNFVTALLKNILRAVHIDDALSKDVSHHETNDDAAMLEKTKTARADNASRDQAIQQAGNSVYVRWGRSTCRNSTELVYAGYVGGAPYDHSGYATNYLCLSPAPVFSDHPALSVIRSYLDGTEYATWDDRHNMDAVCAVCRSQRPSVIMVPGTNVCMAGWTVEYSGYLMAGDMNHAAGSEFICVDSALEDRPGSDASQPAKFLYYTVTHCGSLPCSPYVDSKIVTCVVCSK